MARPLQVGITGGIGSGKSTVAKIFSSLGVPIYDADSRAKFVMSSDGLLISRLKKEFGELAYDTIGNLDRRFLAEQVFGFPDRLIKLNNLVHPRVAQDYKEWLSPHLSHPYILKEAALLFESGSASQLDKIIVVTAPEKLRIERILSRDRRTEKEIQHIMQQQWPEKRSVEKADFVIINDESGAVIPQVLELHHTFLEINHQRSA